MMWVLMVAVIPQTRAKARVHRAHILRATVYSLGWLALVVALGCIDHASMIAHQAAGPGAGRATWLTPWLFGQWLWLLLPWTAAWWYVVIVRHWRIPHGRLPWLVLLVPASIGATVGYVWP